MSCSHSRKICATLIYLALLSNSSNALIVRLADLHQMAKRSDIVIHGYVGEQSVATDELGRLTTLTQIEVIDAMHGSKNGDVITVYQVGGEKNGVVAPVLDGQHYNIGQEVFLFGLKLGDRYVSYGAGQGKLDIVEQQGQELVIEDLGGVSAVSSDAMGKIHLFRPTPLTYSSKSKLKDEIKNALQQR